MEPHESARKWVIAVCVPEFRLVLSLKDALRDSAVIREVATFQELRQHLRTTRSGIDLVVVTPRDRAGSAAAPAVRAIAHAYPDVAIVGYCSAGGGVYSDVRELAVAGAHDFMIAGEESNFALRSLLDQARRGCAAARVRAALAEILPPDLVALLDACLSRPAEIRSVDDLVAATGSHRKTLYNRCRRGGLAGPAEFITWCRLALVAHLLARTGRTADSIADALDFSSPTSLRNLLRRYTGCSATEIRRLGGLDVVIAALRCRLEHPSPAVRLM